MIAKCHFANNKFICGNWAIIKNRIGNADGDMKCSQIEAKISHFVQL